MKRPTKAEIDRAKRLTKGRSNGKGSEWALGWQKRDVGVMLHASNLSCVFRLLKRNPDIALSLDLPMGPKNSKGEDTHPLYAQLVLDRKLCRKAGTLLSMGATGGAPPPDGSPLALLAARGKGQAGGPEAEWSVSLINGEDTVTFYTSIPSLASQIIQRNSPAIREHTLHEFEALNGEERYGVTFKIDASQFRKPETIARVGG